MNEQYLVERNINKLYNDEPTFFLDGRKQALIKQKIGKEKFNIYYPYIDSEKVIFYLKRKPKIILFEILCKEKIKHQDIMGSIFSLGLTNEMFGDIIVSDNSYYFYTFDNLKDYFIANFTKIKNYNISLEEIPLKTLYNYKRKYLEETLIVSSERIDNVISNIIHTNRSVIKDKIKNKEITLNYELLTNTSKILKVGDIFSIKTYGKYRYEGIINSTKKGNIVIKYYKYL